MPLSELLCKAKFSEWVSLAGVGFLGNNENIVPSLLKYINIFDRKAKKTKYTTVIEINIILLFLDFRID
jgi:hypothetical protein